MKWYYLSRISVITLVASLIFFTCNIFMDIPFTRTFEGDVIHYEIVKTDSLQMSGGVKVIHHANITCITPTGKINKFENYELEPESDGKWQYHKVVDENKFYTNNGWMYTFWIILLILSLLMFAMTCAIDGWDDPEQFFESEDNIGKRKCRNIRAQHLIALEKFLGINKEDAEIMDEAYEIFKEHTKNMSYPIVPTYSETIDELNKYIEQIEKSRKQKETGIADGTRS